MTRPGTTWAAVCLALVLRAGAADGKPADSRAQKVRYLLNFTEYVEWPARKFTDDQAPIVIGIIGEDPFGEELTAQAARHRGRRPLEIRRFKGMNEHRGTELPSPRPDPLAPRRQYKAQELRACHVLYISRSEDAFLDQIFRIVGASHVLTVGEKLAFARQGGVICLYDQPPSLGFEISLAAAETAGLKISSRLLDLANAKVIPKADSQTKPLK